MKRSVLALPLVAALCPGCGASPEARQALQDAKEVVAEREAALEAAAASGDDEAFLAAKLALLEARERELEARSRVLSEEQDSAGSLARTISSGALQTILGVFGLGGLLGSGVKKKEVA